MSALITPDVLFLGLLIGGLYGLLALGFVLVYKGTRVLNMAHGDLGATSALVLALAVHDLGWGYWPAFLLALGTGIAIGLIAEVVFVDKLRHAPRLVVLVASIGLAQILVVASRLLISPQMQGRLVNAGYPEPFHLRLNVFGLSIAGAEFFMLLAIPTVGVALTVFFVRSRHGIAIRATAENADNARLVGVSPRKVSLFIWGLAGGLSALAAILFTGASGIPVTLGIGPGLLLRALVPAVLARMSSMPRALAWGMVVGLVEQALVFNLGDATVVDVLLLFSILLALVAQRRSIGRLGELDRSSWPAGQVLSRLPASIRQGIPAKRVRRSAVVFGLVFLATIPLTVPAGQLYVIMLALCFAIAGLSLTILTGYGGQISLGQWAIAGIAAFAAGHVSTGLGWEMWAAVAVAMATGAVASVVIGLPALRLKGLFLAISTLAFAVAASSWLFHTDWFAGGRAGMSVTRPALASDDRSFYYLVLAGLMLAMLFVRVIGRGRLSRNITAVRENEHVAASFGINVVATKLLTFALSGLLAGLAGGMFVFTQGGITGESFRVLLSFTVVMFSIIGGVSSIAGPVIGAGLLMVVPELLPGQAALAALAGGGTLILVCQVLPGGLVTLLHRLESLLLVPRFRTDAASAPTPEPTALPATAERHI